MSPIARMTILAIFGTFLALVIAPSPSLATPVPMPLLNSDNYRRIDIAIRASARSTLVQRDVRNRALDISHLVGDIGVLNSYYQQANQHAVAMRRLSSKASTIGSDYDAYAKECAAQAQGFHTSLLGFRTLLDQLGREKGLANYNRDDQLQTVLKNIVNTNKDFLKSISGMVDGVPAVGPVLGPVVYEVKCILDDVLNAVENLADGLLNTITPLLHGVIDLASTTTCKSGLQIVGICLLG